MQDTELNRFKIEKYTLFKNNVGESAILVRYGHARACLGRHVTSWNIFMTSSQSGLPPCKIWTYLLKRFMRFEKWGNLIGWEPFSKYLENQIFPRHAVFAGLCRTLSWINLENFRNILWLVSEKNTKNHIFWHFSHFFPRTRFFPKNRAPSHFSYYDPLTSCQISERSYV